MIHGDCAGNDHPYRPAPLTGGSAVAPGDRRQEWQNATIGMEVTTIRTHAEVSGFFDGLELLPPGVVQLARWDPGTPVPGAAGPIPAYCGLARKPRCATRTRWPGPGRGRTHEVTIGRALALGAGPCVPACGSGRPTDDAHAIARLHADSWQRHYRGAYSDEFLDSDVAGYLRPVWVERLSVPHPDTRTILAEHHGEVVGLAHTVLGDGATWGRSSTIPTSPTA